MQLEDIKQIRKKLGLTQGELAKKANVSQSLIAKIEAGALDPTYSKAKQLFEAIDNLQGKEEKTADVIMNKKIIIVSPNEQVRKVIHTMKKHSISQLPVVENGSPVGLISESNILDVISDSNRDISALLVKDIMKECPPVLSPSAKKSMIVDLLKYYSVILIAEHGKLKGLISKADVLDSLYS